jgi:chemotaxis protein methyltransferase CheR
VHFRHLDLAQAQWQPPAEAPFDAIFLSNVLIYLDRVTQERILRNVAACLRPDGILFTSRIEGNLGLATTHLKAAGSCTYITARTARRP